MEPVMAPTYCHCQCSDSEEGKLHSTRQ